MPTGHPAPLSEDDLQALVDNRLDAATREALLARVRNDPVATQALADFRAQRAALRGLHAQVLDEPIPSSLQGAARRVTLARQAQRQAWQWGGMAATVALAFGLGWWTHGGVDSTLAQAPGASQARMLAQAGQQFVRFASVAHGVYAPEVRHPVEVTSAQQEHLVQWLSKRLGRSLKLPQLSTAGFELVGGRLLPGDAGARAQFMFQNAAGERVTLYLGAMAVDASVRNTQETAFRFSTQGAVNSFYWMDQGFGYALSGQLTREQLMPLAQLVYQQL